MKDLLRPFKDYFERSDEFKRGMEGFVNVKETDDWKFFSFMLRTIQGVMVNEMLSRKYADLPSEEKDVISRTYYHTNRMIEFFMNPLGEMKKRAKFNLATEQQKEAHLKKVRSANK